MRRIRILLLVFCACSAVTAWPQMPPSPNSGLIPSDVPGVAQVRGATDSNSVDPSQPFVVCTGWHALCTASTDCQMNNINANCDCWRVKETHIVETQSIRDIPVKDLTRAQCTMRHPCALDEAPICKVIRSGQYTVNNVKYDWVSTYSYRGWCGLLKGTLKACFPGAPRYNGDKYWALCDVAPCTEIENPSDPDRPLRCQCLIEDSAFVGTNGSCTGDDGGIISSMPVEAWNFRKNTYRIPIPGYEYVQGACAPLNSDPLTTP